MIVDVLVDLLEREIEGFPEQFEGRPELEPLPLELRDYLIIHYPETGERFRIDIKVTEL